MCIDRATAVQDDPHNKLCLGNGAAWPFGLSCGSVGGFKKVARFSSAGAARDICFFRTFPESIAFPFTPQSSSALGQNSERGKRPAGRAIVARQLFRVDSSQLGKLLNNSVAIVVCFPRYWISAALACPSPTRSLPRLVFRHIFSLYLHM